MAWSEILDWRFALDVLLLTAVVFFIYHSVRSMGTWKVALGLFLAGLIFALASLLGLRGVAWLFAQISPVAALALVIIFQPEIRRILERATSPGFVRRRRSQDLSELFGAAVVELAQRKWGALLVLTRRDPLEQWTTEGKALGGLPSLPLLLSIFDPSSPGHDGAVVIENGRVARFGCKLPLSTSGRSSPDLGTRHSAAMGLAERTDALVIAVSEERGVVTAFSDGRGKQLGGVEEIVASIRQQLEGTPAKVEGPERTRQRVELGLEIAASILLALVIRTYLTARG